jgi:hypothetical protein
MTCDYLAEFTENMVQSDALIGFVCGGIKMCELLCLPFERRAREEVLGK